MSGHVQRVRSLFTASKGAEQQADPLSPIRAFVFVDSTEASKTKIILRGFTSWLGRFQYTNMFYSSI